DHHVYGPTSPGCKARTTSTYPASSKTRDNHSRSSGKNPEFLRLFRQFFKSASVCAIFQSPHTTKSRPCASTCARRSTKYGRNDFMNLSFSSSRSVPTSPACKYTLATVTDPTSASTYRPAPSNTSTPNPTRTASGSRREYNATPARPLANAGHNRTCHPCGSTTSADNCANSARVSCKHTTSASVPANQPKNPGSLRAAARNPLTLTVEISIPSVTPKA